MLDHEKFCGYDFGHVGFFLVVHGHLGYIYILLVTLEMKFFFSCS